MERCQTLQPLFLLEIEQATDQDQSAENDDDGIAPVALQLRHVPEVHSVPADDQRQRHEDRRHDRQHRHDTILLDIQMRLIDIAYLQSVIADRLGGIAKTLDTVDEQAKVTQVVMLEEVVLVLLELLREIEQLLIVYAQGAQVAADLVRAFHVVDVVILALDIVFDRIELDVIALQDIAVVADDLLEKVIQESFQAGQSPLLGHADIIDDLLSGTAVIDEDDTLLIQRERESPLDLIIRAVGDTERTRQGVVVDLRLGRVDLRRLRLDIDTHLEAVFLLRPLCRRQNRYILAAAFQVFKIRFLQGLANQIIQ